jgi:multiple sugar transport system substrate-binding protein
MATIKDVAQLAGVSHGTVTNVLNGTGNVKVDKVKRVMEAVEALGYTPQMAARNLKSNSMNAVAVVLPNVTDSLFAQLYSSVETVLSDAGYSVMLFLSNDIIEKEKQIISVVEGLRAAGIILVTCQPENIEYFQALQKRNVKFVLAEREVNGVDCNFVGFQNAKTLEYATSVMLGRSLAPVGLIAGSGNYSSEQRCVEGYMEALAAAGEVFDSNYIRYTDYTNESGFKPPCSYYRWISLQNL